MYRDRFRSDRIDQSKEVGIGNGTAVNRQSHKDSFAERSQKLDGPRMENRQEDEIGSSTRTDRGDQPPRRGGYRGRRMRRGGFMERSDRNRFEDRGVDSQNGFSTQTVGNEDSDKISDRVERSRFQPRGDQRGHHGWRGGRGAYGRSFARREHPFG